MGEGGLLIGNVVEEDAFSFVGYEKAYEDKTNGPLRQMTIIYVLSMASVLDNQKVVA